VLGMSVEKAVVEPAERVELERHSSARWTISAGRGEADDDVWLDLVRTTPRARA